MIAKGGMNMIITRYCPLCGELTSVVCAESAWSAYKGGALAQDAFPDMDIFTRETLISGMCKPCQMRFFIEDEDDDEEEEDPYEGCFECDNTECPLAK
jgi:hypothetical protein